MAATENERATWSQAFINDLPDSSFLFIEPGGTKDSEGKTSPRSLRHFPVKDGSGNIDMPHLRNALARIPQSSLSPAVKAQCTAKAQRMMASMQGANSEQPPRDNLVRATFPGEIEVRDLGGDTGDAMPTMEVGFARYNEWTEIHSVFEGDFLERIAPGAFTKTIKENAQNMRALFEHGRDPQIGNKVLGPITDIRDTDQGPVAEVPLLDTSYNRDLVPGLREGVYGSSFRFKVMQEEFNRDADRSGHNPDGLPERTILEAKVMELGPVTFPAYAGATAGVRSLTDEFLFGRFAPGTDVHAERADDMHDEGTTTTAEAEPTHSDEDETSRDTPTDDDRQPAEPTTSDKETAMGIIDEMRERQVEIRRELEEISSEYQGQVLTGDVDTRFNALEKEWLDLEARCEAEQRRRETLRRMADDPAHTEGGSDGQHTPARSFDHVGTGTYVTKRDGRDKTPEDPFDMAGYHSRATSQEHLWRMFGDGARRAVERLNYPHPRADRDHINTQLERLLRQDSPDKEIAQRILLCGSPAYRSAFWKNLLKQPLNQEEQRALAVGAIATGGAAVPIAIDPTVISTSNGVINPIRQIARVRTTTSYEWRGVTAAAITSAYAAEGAAMSDNTPTLAQPTMRPQRAQAFIPFSWEIGQDWGSLESELASLLQDSRDTLEATKFASGSGTTEPLGFITGGTFGVNPVTTVGGTAFAVADIYKLENQLPVAHQPNASWVATPAMFAKVRQLDTYGGANMWSDSTGPGAGPLAAANPARLIGYPAYKCSTAGTAGPDLTATAVWGVFGDFNKFQITDRIGLEIRTIDTLFSGATQGDIAMPTGQSGLVAFWRNTSAWLDPNACRVGTISTSAS